MGSHSVLFLLYLNIVLNWPEDGRSRPKYVAKYNLIVIIASCLDVCCLLTVHNILYELCSSVMCASTALTPFVSVSQSNVFHTRAAHVVH